MAASTSSFHSRARRASAPIRSSCSPRVGQPVSRVRLGLRPTGGRSLCRRTWLSTPKWTCIWQKTVTFSAPASTSACLVSSAKLPRAWWMKRTSFVRTQRPRAATSTLRSIWSEPNRLARAPKAEHGGCRSWYRWSLAFSSCSIWLWPSLLFESVCAGKALASCGDLGSASSQPSHASESPVQHRACDQDHAHDGDVTIFPLQFRHVLEVHAVDSGDRGRDRDDGKPRGQFFGDRGFLSLTDQKARFEGKCKNLSKRVDLLLNCPDVVRDVAEQRLHGGPHHRQVVMLKPAANLHQGPDRVSQAQQVASQQIKPLDLRPCHCARKHQRLHGLDFLLDGFEHRRIVIDDEIEDGVEDIVLAAGQRPRAALAALAYRRIGRRRAMTDRNKISFADEQMSLAKCDAVANELSGARHDEQPVAILLDLRSLVGVVRVLDGEIVQLELLLYAGQERDIRFVQPDPHHMARPAAPA